MSDPGIPVVNPLDGGTNYGIVTKSPDIGNNAIVKGIDAMIVGGSEVTISDTNEVLTNGSFKVSKDSGANYLTGGVFLNDSGGNAVNRYTPGIHFGNGGVYHSKLTVKQDDTFQDDNGSLEFWTNAGGYATRNSFTINYGTAWFYNVVSAASYDTRSDKNLKDEIKDFSISTDFVNKIRPVTFKWKDRDDKSTKVGLIAQELREILPSAVGEDKDGYLTIDYGQVTVSLIQIIKDLNDRVLSLEKK